MNNLPANALHLTSEWFIKPGCEVEVDLALIELVAKVYANEPDTLIYMPHRPIRNTPELQSLPPADPASVLFFEVYRNKEAFHAHVTGPVFTDFVTRYGHLFVCSNGKPYTTVEFMHLIKGFIR
ncbi:MAG: antibiotic biosynthesis monooxygenase [Sulfuricellaceae bacterium]